MLRVDIMRTKRDIFSCYLLPPLVKYPMPTHTNCNLYPNQYNRIMKPVRFLGDSLKCLREFPEDAKQDAGYQLDKVQKGKQPDNFKPMPSIGMGVEEIRIRDDSGIYRLIYTARLPMPCMYSTPSKRRRKPPPGATLKLLRNALRN